MMEYEKIDSIKNIVIDCLTRYPASRDSDDYLYFRVCEFVNPDIIAIPFAQYFLHRKDYGLPSYESVSRARRKAQHSNPDLSATIEVQEARAEIETFMHKWSVT